MYEKCLCCNRKISKPISQMIGFGPECYKKLGISLITVINKEGNKEQKVARQGFFSF